MNKNENFSLNDLYPKYNTGKIFGNWTILYKTTKRKVLCQCKCGTIKELYRTNLGSGKSISCGCSRKSGIENTKLYNVWHGMKNRCFNKNHKFYNHYGFRGITVCDEWINDVKAFYEWAMQNGYKEGLTLDRIDNNESYNPKNCRWITQKEQDNNKRNNLIICYNGQNKTASQWSEYYGINYRTLLSRIRAGWKNEELFIPVERRKNNE